MKLTIWLTGCLSLTAMFITLACVTQLPNLWAACTTGTFLTGYAVSLIGVVKWGW